MVQNQDGAQGKSESTPKTATKRPMPRNRSSTSHLSSASSAVSPASSCSKSIKGKKDNKLPSTQTQPKASDDSANVKPVSESDVREPSRSNQDLDKCPCNRSTDNWKIDCSKCKQFWHLDCVSLTGLTDKDINRMLNYLCPFCYVAPIPTVKLDAGCCFTCRNTNTLREANHEFEVASTADKLTTLSMSLNNSDSEIMKAHYQSIKNIESDISTLAHIYDNSLEHLVKQIAKLKLDVHQLEPSHQPPSSESATADSDSFLKTISEKLELLCDDSLLRQHQESRNLPDLPPHLKSPGPAHNQTPAPAPPPVQHNETNVTDIKLDFITEATSSDLTEFLASSTFASENGHSVLAFGAPYTYTGSKSCTSPPPIPDILQPIFDKVNELQKEVYLNKYPELRKANYAAQIPEINSCLVNMYNGPQSYLPLHADDEVTINPESSIFTLSLGSSCQVKFIENDSNTSTEITCPSQSLYHMTCRSQKFFKHCIEAGSISGTRYSLTFRSVNWKNRNSTCIVGDSNTGLLRFGSNKRSSFGELMPGCKFWAPHIQSIEPQLCAPYSNAVILCGINDIKQPDVKCERDIKNLCDLLMLKVKQIKLLNSKCSIYVCPLLPTKDFNLNKRVNLFNKLIRYYLMT